MLWHFGEMVKTGRPQVPPQDTLDAMRLLLAGRRSRETGRSVVLSDVAL
jgi:predicted dehydrogenase